MALAALRTAAGAGRNAAGLLRQGAPAAAAAAAQSRGVSSHSENTNTFIREVGAAVFACVQETRHRACTCKLSSKFNAYAAMKAYRHSRTWMRFTWSCRFVAGAPRA